MRAVTLDPGQALSGYFAAASRLRQRITEDRLSWITAAQAMQGFCNNRHIPTPIRNASRRAIEEIVERAAVVPVEPPKGAA